MKADALMQSIKGWIEKLTAELQEGQTQGFLAFLEKAGRFHRYSARNVMLIHQQRPEATLVAGIKRWNELGRRVKKGERGIAILAPTVKRVEEVDEATGEVREERRLVGFHTTYVFDVSQTEGEPLEPEGEEIPQGPALYERLRAACPVAVQEGLLPGGALGKTNGKRIVLAADQGHTRKAETLLHEWAHVLLHVNVRGALTERELEAAATGYVVGRELGLEMRETRGYVQAITRRIQEKRGGKPLWEADVDFLERILWAAREMLSRIGALERPLQA